MQSILDKIVAALVSGVVAFIISLSASQIGGFFDKKEIFFINLGTAMDGQDGSDTVATTRSSEVPVGGQGIANTSVSIDRSNFQSGLVLVNSGVDISESFTLNVKFDDDTKIEGFRLKAPDSFLDSDIKIEHNSETRPGLFRVKLNKFQPYERIAIFPITNRSINIERVSSTSSKISVSQAIVSRLDKSPFYINVILAFGFFIGIVASGIFYVLQKKISVSLSVK